MTVVATKEEQLIIVMGEVERILTCPLEKLKVQLSKSFLNKDIKEELLKLMFFSDSKSSIVEKLKEIDKEYKRQLNYPNKVPFTTEEDFNSLSQTRLSTSKEFGQQFKEMNIITDDVVPYKSAHLEGAISEKILKGGHSIQETPEAVLELRRILRQHLVELGLYKP